jgi:hypothetical protein
VQERLESSVAIQIKCAMLLGVCRSCWEQVDSGTWANNALRLKPGGRYCAIREDQIYILKPDQEDHLGQLQV